MGIAGLIVFAGVVGASFTAASPNQVPEDPNIKAYWPAVVGTKWVYLVNGSDTLVQKVTKVTRYIDHTQIVISDEWDGKDTPSDLLIVNRDGVQRVGNSGVSKPRLVQFPVLRFPLKDGAKWPVDCGPEVVGTSRVFGPEKVKVPAGTYQATRIESEYTQHGQTRHHDKCWYAPGVGLVRQTIDGERYKELVLFTPGKAE